MRRSASNEFQMQFHQEKTSSVSNLANEWNILSETGSYLAHRYLAPCPVIHQD